MALETKMIFKTNRGGTLLQIGSEAWNLPALSFLSCGSAQPSSVLLCGHSSPDAPSTGSGYRHNNQISVAIEPGASLIHARMRALLADLDEGEFTEGDELDRK